MLRMLIRGYREANNKDEFYLHKALRTTSDIELFKTICMVLGNSGGLFGVPTLMAYGKDRNSLKGQYATSAISEIRKRTKALEADDEMKNFFDPAWWQPKWVGSKDKLISYVAFLAGMMENDKLFEGEIMDKTAERLMREMEIDRSV